MEKKEKKELTNQLIEVICEDIIDLEQKIRAFEDKISDEGSKDFKYDGYPDCEECKKKDIDSWRICRISDILETMLSYIVIYTQIDEKDSGHPQTKKRDTCRKLSHH